MKTPNPSIFILILIVFGLSSISYSQKQTDLIAWSADRPLKWTDFKGKAPISPNHAATSGGISTSFESLKDGNMKFTLLLHFDAQKSWKKKDATSAELLRHEQIHFDIYEMYARIFMKRIKETEVLFRNDRGKELGKMFKAMFNELEALQNKYDEETQHSKDKKKQAEWDEIITKGLKEMEVYSEKEIVYNPNETPKK